jgi:AcrR family transcriptional regulator
MCKDLRRSSRRRRLCQDGGTLMASEKRPYELRRRAETMAATRARIAQAAADLHGTVGPARTTISAVAERAGVQRHTVYRHFPTEAELYAACSACSFAANPWPDVETWGAIRDPVRRLRHALDELYGYYERTDAMLTNLLRDAPLVPSLEPALVPFHAFVYDAGDVLAEGWRVRGRRQRLVEAAARHVVDFHTWRSLARQGGISRAEAIELAATMVEHTAR